MKYGKVWGWVVVGSSIILFTAVAIAAPPTVDTRKVAQTKYVFYRLEKGESDAVIETCSESVKENPEDLESLYALAAAYAHRGQIDTAMTYVKKAVEGGLPLERFIVGPRSELAPLTASRAFKKYVHEHPVGELLHGPMLGAVTDTSARFWVRTATEVPFRVRVSMSRTMDGSINSTTVRTSATEDFTGVVEVSGLEPDTRYYYNVLVNGKVVPLEPHPSFRTYPKRGAKARFGVAFGGGSGNSARYEWMWDTIRSRSPLAFLGLGDNNYYNLPEPLAVSRLCYYTRHSRPEWRRMVASTAVYGIWDDHDFAGNDSIGGPQIDVPAWKRPIWHVFKENWVNPYYGGGETLPGCWHDFSIGDVDFFMLDCRYYRTDPQGKEPVFTDPDAAHPSMLGPVQKRWLLDKLGASTATFKVIAASVPWTFGSKTGTQTSSTLGRRPGAEDTWEGFPEEREEIFSFIEKNRIEGVYLISADRHRSDAWKIERKNGYDFYEASTSHLTKRGSHPLMPKAIFSHRGKPMFGLLTFDTTKADPELTYQVVDIDNEVVDTLVVRRSQLSFTGSGSN